ncbi:MAG: alcohol dehydrogenase catalytic domain-containing protein, partial [Pseudomonadota bacterium]
MQTIKAAVCKAFGAPLEIEDILIRGPETGEIEVVLDAVAICHSDISYADGAWGGSLPAVYGHEAAGRVRAVGPGVTGIAEGDSVVVTLIRACGACASCASGKPTVCQTAYDGDAGPIRTAEGGKLHQAMACGAFAERVVVDRSQVVKIPDDMPKDAASLIACGVITGVGAVVNAAGLRAGEDVVVIGAGGVGLNAIQGARIAGARRIVAVDMTEDKL